MDLMSEFIDESVSVALASSHTSHTAVPCVIGWRGRQYKINKVGLHHTTREGRVLFHIFSVSDGTTFFKLRFDTETLGWRLLEVEGT